MKNFGSNIVSLLQEEDGVSAIEYAVLLTLVVIICIAAMAMAGVEPHANFQP
jgi:pilus assembly protein Flp/PilA